MGHRMGRVAAEPQLCRLEHTLGRSVVCPGDRCPFWEPGGAVLDGRCALHGLDLTRGRELARWLLELRARLETAGPVAEDEQLRHLYHRLANEGEDE